SDHLVVGAEPEVAADPGRLLVLAVRVLAAGEAAERIATEAEAEDEPDREQEVAEHQRDVVLTRVDEEVEAGGVDLVADHPTDVEAGDAADEPGEEVEADEATPQRAGGGIAHPPLLSGFG